MFARGRLQDVAVILLIDDEPQVRSLLRRALERNGHSVLEAGDGSEGLEAASEKSVDLVITDIIMPGVDGIELIIELRERRPAVPILAMSGGGMVVPPDLLLGNARELGAIISISKPFEMSDFLLAVNAALASKRKTGEG